MNRYDPFNSLAAAKAHVDANVMVSEERLRQVREKGYSAEHDDQYATEELASAAAFYLLPVWMNMDVCTANEGNLVVESLFEMVGESTFVAYREDDDPEGNLEQRIENVTKGIALGMAELERLLRMKAVSA